MKIKYITTLLCLGAIFFLSGCNDDLTLVGSTIQPKGDKNTVYTDTFQMLASTIKKDSLFARTNDGLLGEIYDPLYGKLKSDYLCQFYCSENYKFPHTPYNGIIDSVSLKINFEYWTGDPYALMGAKVYAIKKPLKKNYYTNLPVEDYYDMNSVLGSKAYAALSSRIIHIDSIKNLRTNAYEYRYYRTINIPLLSELGTRFYNETVNNPSSFANQEAFNRFFPGLYITTDYGSGNIIQVDNTLLYFYFRRPKSSKNDSLVRDSVVFQVTKEVIQHNRFQSFNDERLLAPNDKYAFVKTPAGIYPRFVIPSKEIARKVKGRLLNTMILDLKYTPEENWKYAMNPPSHLLLMPEDSLPKFFENRNVENGITTFISTDGTSPLYTNLGYNRASRTYSFSNIINLLQTHMKNKPDEDLRVLAVPVNRIYAIQQESRASTVYYYTKTFENYLIPSGVKIKTDKESMKIVILSNKYEN